MELKNNGSIQEEDLLKFEQQQKVELPKAYRQFLLKNNGGIPQQAEFSTKDSQFSDAIEAFLGIGVEGLHGFDYIFETYKGRYPAEDFFPIGKTVSGNLLLLGLKGEYKSKIYLWDHNWESDDDEDVAYDNIHLVAKEFTSFIENTKVVEDDYYGDLVELFDSGNNKKMKQLIESGWDVNTKLEIGGTAIQRCALHGNTEILSLLLKNKANTDGAVGKAFTFEQLDAIKILLNAGADPNELVNGNPLLSKAIIKKKVEIVKLLLAAGADKMLPNEYGKSPLDIANKKLAQGVPEMDEIVRLLE